MQRDSSKHRFVGPPRRRVESQFLGPRRDSTQQLVQVWITHRTWRQWGDFESAARDCTEQVKAGMPGLVPLLPQPVTSSEVVRVEQQGDGAVVEIAYRGSDKELTLRSEWHEQGARPLITAAAF